jgi:hypothetical protein
MILDFNVVGEKFQCNHSPVPCGGLEETMTRFLLPIRWSGIVSLSTMSQKDSPKMLGSKWAKLSPINLNVSLAIFFL